MSAPPSAAFWVSHVAYNTTQWASIWGTDEVFCDALLEHLTPEAKAHLRFLVGRMDDDDDDDDALFGTARSREDTGPHGTLRKQTRAGALAALATTPFDVAKTRAMVDAHLDRGGDRSTWDNMRTIARAEGPRALLAGAAPRLLKVAPACGIMIGSYEYAKAAFAGA